MAALKAGRQIFTTESFMARFGQAAKIEILRTVTHVISSRINFHDSENSVRDWLLDRVRRESGIRKSLNPRNSDKPAMLDLSG